MNKPEYKPIKKALIPAAGWGTRFLPQTKAMPKEMLPIVDKPVIQFVVEEMVSGGVEDVIIITGIYKRAIEDHFDRSLELEAYLKDKGKDKELETIKKIGNMANFVYIRQKGEKYGNAIAVLAGKPAIGNEPFIMTWGDEFIHASPTRFNQILDVYKKNPGIVISAVEIEDKNALSRYGIADVEEIEDGVYKIKEIVEKPDPETAPSNIATHGAYILPPEIFDVIEKLEPRKNGEYNITDAINKMIKDGYPAYACKIKNGKYYDTGNKLEYLKTVIDFGLKDEDFGEDLKKYLKDTL